MLKNLMLDAQFLCPRTQISETVLGEVEMNRFIALPGKGEHGGLMPWKTMCPNLRAFGEELYSNGSRVGLMLGCVQGLCSFNLASGGLLLNFCGSFNLASSGFLNFSEECFIK